MGCAPSNEQKKEENKNDTAETKSRGADESASSNTNNGTANSSSSNGAPEEQNGESAERAENGKAEEAPADHDDIPPPEDDHRHVTKTPVAEGEGAEEVEQGEQKKAEENNNDEERRASSDNAEGEGPQVVTIETTAQPAVSDSPPPPDDPCRDQSSGCVIMSNESSGVHQSPLSGQGSGGGFGQQPDLAGSGRSNEEAGSGLSGSFPAPSKRELWIEYASALPTSKEDDQKSSELFAKFVGGDVTDSTTLCVSDLNSGCREHLSLHLIMDPLEPMLKHACAQVLNKPGGDDDPNTVGVSQFRYVMLYVQGFLDLYVMFQEVDSSEDRRVDEDEFTRSLGKLEQWDVPPVEDPAAAFRAVDTEGQGMVMFDAFADWALGLRLTHEK